MTTAIKKRAIPPVMGTNYKPTLDGLFVSVNELSGAIGENAQRAIRVCELLDAGIITLDVDGAVVKPGAGTGQTPSPGLYVEKAGDVMSGPLFGTSLSMSSTVTAVGDILTTGGYLRNRRTIPRLYLEAPAQINGYYLDANVSDGVFGDLTVKRRDNGAILLAVSNAGSVTVAATIQSNNGIMRSQGYAGSADSGVYYFGEVALDAYIYRPSGAQQFSFKYGSGTAVLNSAGTIWTTGNFTPGNYVAKTGDTMTGQLTMSGSAGVHILSNAIHQRMRNAAVTTNPASFFDIGQNPSGAAGDNDGYLYARVGGIVIATANTLRGTMFSTGEFRWTGGEIQSTVANAHRMVQGNYGAILRQDGANFYFLMTASGDQYGSWNALRPLMINMVTGSITFGHGVTVNQSIDSAGSNLILGAQGGNVYFRPNGSGSATGEARLDAAGNFTARDFYAIRPALPTTGVIYLGNTGARYLFYDGTKYVLPSAEVHAPNFVATSDRRLKDNLRRQLPLIALADIALWDWDWKDGRGRGRGVIAQEVQEIAPGYVSATADGTLGVDKAGLALELALLALNQIKEQRTCH